MLTISTIADLRQTIHDWRRSGLKIAFVPTMGNLHDGHLQLVEAARKLGDKVVVSIFVNPTQFGPNEDYARYPRTERQDADKLAAAHTDLLFLPTVDEIYPQQPQTSISVAGLSALHCGACRPGHFDGVALVVCKLLNMVQPDQLLLGEKDFQQLAVIRRMVADLNIPVQIHGVPTVRESSGLAMSSRNSYLTSDEKNLAPLLYRAISTVRNEILNGNNDYAGLVSREVGTLQHAGFAIDYFEVCRATDLLPADANDTQLVILIAAKLGKTRLIDNIHFDKIHGA